MSCWSLAGIPSRRHRERKRSDPASKGLDCVVAFAPRNDEAIASNFYSPCQTAGRWSSPGLTGRSSIPEKVIVTRDGPETLDALPSRGMTDLGTRPHLRDATTPG